jgi:hypothetical protein
MKQKPEFVFFLADSATAICPATNAGLPSFLSVEPVLV